MKNRIWIIVFSAVLLICTALWLIFQSVSPQTRIVGIYQNGELVEKINLDLVTDKREITLNGDFGKNVIAVSNGQIKMLSADCPDKICVNHKELKSEGSPIVCLPNKVIIKFENRQTATDAKAGAVI